MLCQSGSDRIKTTSESPCREPTRLKHRDYSSPGLYFVTVCAHYKRCMFGWVTQTGVELSALGHIVHESWVAIERHFARVNLHGFVIMPNHVHGIIEIASTGLAQHAVPLQRRLPIQILPNPSSLSVIVRSFKAEVTRRGRLELHWKGEVWQRNYYDRVLRDGQEYSDASRYVAENPVRWRSFQAMPTKGKKDAERLAQHAVPLQRSDG